MKYDSILYGKDPENNIVGIHQHGENIIRIYSRDEQDEVTFRDELIHPFMWLSGDGRAQLEAKYPQVAKCYNLKGKQHYGHLAVFENGKDLRTVRKNLKAKGEDPITYSTSLLSQYLMQSGKTYYKGMSPRTVRRMQVDIETYSTTGGMSNAKRSGDEIIIIAMCDNRGWECVLHTSERMKDLPSPYVYCANEAWMLVEFVKTVHRINPDVLELHNGFGFDLPYIRDRAKLHEVNLALGRNGKVPSTHHAKKKFGERDFEYENFRIDGRCVIDTMFLAVDYDVYKRDLPGVGLKPVAKHFGVAAADREYVEGDQITPTWDADPARLLKYALHDVYETRAISDILCNSQFYLTQMVPMDYQTLHNAGKAAIIESLFLREYLRQRHSIPKPDKGKQEWGGYTDLFRRGVYDDVAYFDVASLYPSIMLNYNIQPKRDELALFQYFLQRLTDLRFESKNAMKALDKGDPMRTELDARQSAYKIVINSFYGMAGFLHALFNDFSEADRVARTGQGLLKRMFGIIECIGGVPVLCDTDGVLAMLPTVERVREGLTETEMEQYGHLFEGSGKLTNAQVTTLAEKIVTGRMPHGINIDDDGRFERVLAYRKKNYILRSYEGKVKITGGSFKSRSIEPFGREYVEEVALALLDRDVTAVREIHDRYKSTIINRAWGPDAFCKRATLKKSLEEYVQSLDNENVTQQAQYELALELQEEHDQDMFSGDTVEYYIGGNKPISKVKGYEDAKLRSQWTPGDENTRWYLKRLKTFAKKFEFFFEKEDFKKVFNSKVEFTAAMFDEPLRLDINIVNTTLKQKPD